MKSSSATWKRSVCLTVACLTQLTVLVYAEKVATNEDLEAFLKRKGGSVAKSNGKVANTDQGVPLQLDIKPAPIVESVSEVRCELGSAVLSGDLSKVQAMLDKGCDPNVRDEITGGNTPLCYAAFKGSDEIIRLLVSKGAEINTTDESAISALLLAVMGKHLSSVKLLLDAGANPDFVGGAPDGSTPLINATLGDGDIRIMQLLLEHNANPNLTNRINAFTA